MELYFKYLIYFFCFFPFIFPINTLGTDIQFYAFIVSIAYLVSLSEYHYSIEIKIFCFVFLIAAIIGVLSASNIMILIKCLFQYASLFIISLAVYNLLIREGGLDESLCKKLILCWFFVGAVQTFIYPKFFMSIVANARTTLDRGVCALASEPSFFGLQCFYFIFIAAIFDKCRNLYWLMISIMALLFAQSFTGLAFVFFMLLCFASDHISFRRISLKWIFISLTVIATSSYFVVDFFRNSRLGKIISVLVSNQNLVSKDESSSVRFRAITESLQTSLDNVFMPNGFTERIGSMFGGILQELGVLGLPLMGMITYLFASYFSKYSVKYVAFVICFLLLFTNMQMANPTLAFVLAIGIYRKNHCKQQYLIKPSCL